jgi:KDO2-lipid IV(A) lauroyltransferase
MADSDEAMIDHRSVVKDLGRILFWYPLRWIVLLLPFKAVHGIGGMLGRLDVVLSGRQRTARMAAHLERTLGCTDSEARRLVCANLQNHIRNVLEFIKYPQLNAANLARVVTILGREHLDQALLQGRGIVLCTAHFGAKQMLQVALGHSGYRINQINYYKPDTELSWIQRHVGQRLRHEIEKKIPAVFVSAVGSLRPVFRCLRDNEVVIVTGDGSGVPEHITKSHPVVDFLGRKMFMPTGPVTLARRTGAALVPAFVFRHGHRHRVVIEPAVAVPAEAPEADGVAQLARTIERVVRTAPELWEFWEEFEEGHLIPATPAKAQAGEPPQAAASREPPDV